MNCKKTCLPLARQTHTPAPNLTPLAESMLMCRAAQIKGSNLLLWKPEVVIMCHSCVTLEVAIFIIKQPWPYCFIFLQMFISVWLCSGGSLSVCVLTAVCDVIFVVMSPADQYRHNTSYSSRWQTSLSRYDWPPQHEQISVLKQMWAAYGDHWQVNNSKRGVWKYLHTDVHCEVIISQPVLLS